MKPFIPFPFPLPFLHFFPLLIPLLPQVLFLLPDFPRLLFAADADGFHDEEFSFIRMFHAGFAFQISVGKERPVPIVKSMFLKLDKDHICYILKCLHNTEKKKE